MQEGLKIRTVTEQEFTVSGPVEYRDGVYYCAGASWPEEIVKKVLATTGEAVSENV